MLLTNGTVTKSGKQLIFKCDTGYDLIGEQTSNCIRGTYDSPKPNCTGMLT